jgi:hypothetical protein
MNFIILLKLLFSHVICDFVFQTRKMVDAKHGNNKKGKIRTLIRP